MLLCAMALLPGENVSRETFSLTTFAFIVRPLGEILVFDDYALVDSDRRRIAQIRGRPDITQVPFSAFCDFSFALRPVGLERRLPLHLRLVEIGEAVVREGKEERNHI